VLGLSRNFGLTALLGGKRQHLEEVVHQLPVAPRMNGSGSIRTMDVLLAGPPARNPSELLDSDRMRQLLVEAESQYDLVIIDTPPATVVSDGIPLMKHVNAVLVVGRVGKLTQNLAARLREQLEKVHAPTIGVVANFTTMKDGGYTGGGYYHDHKERLEAGV
jgi:Mrp family chromosome partitioning ATPase